ncbi:hypothetical protein THAOC_07277, partial [Thalassiosira oceanica]
HNHKEHNHGQHSDGAAEVVTQEAKPEIVNEPGLVLQEAEPEIVSQEAAEPGLIYEDAASEVVSQSEGAGVEPEHYHEHDGHVHDRNDHTSSGHNTVHQHDHDRNQNKTHDGSGSTVLQTDDIEATKQKYWNEALAVVAESSSKCSITLPNGSQIYAPCHGDEPENTHVVTSETAEEKEEDEKITSWFADHGVKPVATVHAKPVEHARPAGEDDPTLVVDVHPDAIPEGLEAHTVVHATASGKEKVKYVKAEPVVTTVDGKHAVHGTPVEGTTGTQVTATAHAVPVSASAPRQDEQEQERSSGGSGAGTTLIVLGVRPRRGGRRVRRPDVPEEARARLPQEGRRQLRIEPRQQPRPGREEREALHGRRQPRRRRDGVRMRDR